MNIDMAKMSCADKCYTVWGSTFLEYARSNGNSAVSLQNKSVVDEKLYFYPWQISEKCCCFLVC